MARTDGRRQWLTACVTLSGEVWTALKYDVRRDVIPSFAQSVYGNDPRRGLTLSTTEPAQLSRYKDWTKSRRAEESGFHSEREKYFFLSS